MLCKTNSTKSTYSEDYFLFTKLNYSCKTVTDTSQRKY